MRAFFDFRELPVGNLRDVEGWVTEPAWVNPPVDTGEGFARRVRETQYEFDGSFNRLGGLMRGGVDSARMGPNDNYAEWVALMRFPFLVDTSTTQQAGFALAAPDDWGPAATPPSSPMYDLDGNRFYVYPTGGGGDLETVGGAAVPPVEDEWFLLRIRVRIEPAIIWGKLWRPADAEPEAWDSESAIPLTGWWPAGYGQGERLGIGCFINTFEGVDWAWMGVASSELEDDELIAPMEALDGGGGGRSRLYRLAGVR